MGMICFIFLGGGGGKIPVRVAAPRFELTSQRQKVSRLPTEPPGRTAIHVMFFLCFSEDFGAIRNNPFWFEYYYLIVL